MAGSRHGFVWSCCGAQGTFAEGCTATKDDSNHDDDKGDEGNDDDDDDDDWKQQQQQQHSTTKTNRIEWYRDFNLNELLYYLSI